MELLVCLASSCCCHSLSFFARTTLCVHCAWYFQHTVWLMITCMCQWNGNICMRICEYFHWILNSPRVTSFTISMQHQWYSNGIQSVFCEEWNEQNQKLMKSWVIIIYEIFKFQNRIHFWKSIYWIFCYTVHTESDVIHMRERER